MIALQNNPFIRILIPFVAGILLFTTHHFTLNVFYPLLVSLGILAILFFMNRKQTSQQSKRIYILASDVFLFLAGFYCCYVYDIKNDSDYFGNYVTTEQQSWVGEIKDLPVEKERSVKVMMEVKIVDDKRQLTGKALVYLKKPIDISILKPGNILKIESAFIQPRLPLNPHEFNYKEFLENRNIYYQSFVETGNFELVSEEPGFSLFDFGLHIKQKIKTVFETSGLKKEAAQLCIALLTGYDDEISPETINAFAHSGTLHVLSVSGLHTGILYGVLIFLLGVVDKHQKYKLLHLIIITLCLWFFVLITGFSPPVLRAAIMLNLIALGRFYYSYSSSHSLNILAVSAFMILVFDPLLIYDTGFLLSYSAVLGIIYFEPVFTPIVNTKYKIIKKIWQLTSVSLAAQITTLPITLFLFHQFPLWFVFSNLIVIPLCAVIMVLGILILIKMSFIAPLLSLCSMIIFYCIHLTDTPGIGYIDNIDFGWTDLMFLSALIIAIAVFVKERQYSYVSTAAMLLILWQATSLFEVIHKRSSSHISIYHVNKQSAVDLKNAGILYFNSKVSNADYNYHIKPNHTFYNHPELENVKFDLVKSASNSFLKVSSSDQQQLISFLKPNYLLVTNNTELEEMYFPNTIRMVIADGSNKYQNIKKLKALCDKFAVPFHSTAEKGYIELNL